MLQWQQAAEWAVFIKIGVKALAARKRFNCHRVSYTIKCNSAEKIEVHTNLC